MYLHALDGKGRGRYNVLKVTEIQAESPALLTLKEVQQCLAWGSEGHPKEFGCSHTGKLSQLNFTKTFPSPNLWITLLVLKEEAS